MGHLVVIVDVDSGGGPNYGRQGRKEAMEDLDVVVVGILTEVLCIVVV